MLSPSPPSSVGCVETKLTGGGEWRRGPHFDELLHLYPKSFGQGSSYH